MRVADPNAKVVVVLGATHNTPNSQCTPIQDRGWQCNDEQEARRMHVWLNDNGISSKIITLGEAQRLEQMQGKIRDRDGGSYY
jgi:hypothetical protein